MISGTFLRSQVLKKRMIGDFAGRHLDALHPKRNQEIRCLFVERRRHELNVQFVAAADQLAMQFFRHLQFLEHVELVAIAGFTLLVFGLLRARTHQLFRGKGLELDGVSPAARSGIHQLAAPVRRCRYD